MNYGEILTKAWKTIWKHKILWLFGLLASCAQSRGGGGGGGGGGSNANFNFNQDPGSFQPPNGWENFGPGMEQFGREMERFFNQPENMATIIAIIIGLICFFMVLGLIFLAIGTMGRIGLVRGTVQSEEGAEKLSFGQIWNASKPFFWRVLGFSILYSIATGLLGLILAIPVLLITVVTLGCGLLCLIPLLIAYGWLVNLLMEQTIVAIVVEDSSITDGLSRAWSVIRNNLVHMLVISLILYIGSLVIGFLIALPFIGAVIPLVVGAINGAENALRTGAVVTIAILCLLTPLAMLVGAMLSAYLGVAWTLVYRTLSGKTPASPVVAAPLPVEPILPLDTVKPAEVETPSSDVWTTEPPETEKKENDLPGSF